MRKIQIQIPEKLFQEVSTFARHREWSLTETFRRGAQLSLDAYPESPRPETTAWTPPTSSKVGWKGLTHTQLRNAAFTDGDPRQG